ncbi:unnamed protein product, partial [Heterotrigona itama]
NLFNLKFAVKELERNSKKCEKEEKVEKAKIKKAIQKGNMEGARIHAENAIRQRNQALNYLRMSARVDAVASRVQTALTTRKVTQSMAGVVKAMDAAMKSMNLEKISGLMDKFESQFEDLDVQSSYMENAMSQTTTTNIPQNDVDSLLQQVADEAGLELNMELPSGQLGSIGTSTVSQEQDELTQRLARLQVYGSSVIKCKFDDISKFRNTSLMGGTSGNSKVVNPLNSVLYLREKMASYQTRATLIFLISAGLQVLLNIFSLKVAANQHRANLPFLLRESSSIE